MKTPQLLVWILVTISLVMLKSCAVDDRSLEQTKSENPQVTVSEEEIDSDLEDDVIVSDQELSEYVTLSFDLGDQTNTSGRSLTRTAVGTFEEITKLYVNANREGKESLIYSDPGRELIKQTDSSWKGTLDGFIVNESYDIHVTAMNISGVRIFTGMTKHTIQGGGNELNRYHSLPCSQ